MEALLLLPAIPVAVIVLSPLILAALLMVHWALTVGFSLAYGLLGARDA